MIFHSRLKSTRENKHMIQRCLLTMALKLSNDQNYIENVNRHKIIFDYQAMLHTFLKQNKRKNSSVMLISRNGQSVRI